MLSSGHEHVLLMLAVVGCTYLVNVCCNGHQLRPPPRSPPLPRQLRTVISDRLAITLFHGKSTGAYYACELQFSIQITAWSWRAYYNRIFMVCTPVSDFLLLFCMCIFITLFNICVTSLISSVKLLSLYYNYTHTRILVVVCVAACS